MNIGKKIVLLSSSLAGGGSEGVCVNIANNLALRGWHVDLLVLNLNKAVYLNRLSEDVNLINLDISHARYSSISLLKYIFKNKPKVFLVFSYELSTILVILQITLKLRIKIISRNVSTLSIRIEQLRQKNFWSKYFTGPLIKFFYQKIDHVVNQCKGMHDDLLKEYPKLHKRASIIFNPISSQISDYAKSQELNIVKKKNYILCVGRLEKVKAFNYAIEAFAGISNRFPKLRLKIVGKGSLEIELKKKAYELSVSDRVDFEGFQKNVIPYYLHAQATMLTSLYEGYPNALIESISLGTPVIAFNCKSGPDEIIQNNINGFLVRHLDVQDLKDKMVKILNTNFDRKKIILTVQKNQIEYVSKLYEKLIKSMISI